MHTSEPALLDAEDECQEEEEEEEEELEEEDPYCDDSWPPKPPPRDTWNMKLGYISVSQDK